MKPQISNRNPIAGSRPLKKPATPKKAKAEEGVSEPRDWKDQLAAFGEVLQRREDLGISDALSNKEASEIVTGILADDSPTEDLAVIAERRMAEEGMNPRFTSQIQEVAAAVKEAPKPDHECVVDMRDKPWVSVDNGDLNPLTGKLENQSKDIDQCEYAERLPNGNIKMLVAIADVDAAVKKGDLVDQQAMRQSATVYTDGGIFPMLPRRLSEDLTSLDEGTDRLATIKEFEVTPGGEIANPKLYRGYINNKAQMAYDSVNESLTDGPGARPPQMEDPVLAEQIQLQDEAAQRLRHFFHAKGSLDIESSEARVQLDGDDVVGMKKETQTRAKDKVKYNMMAANITTMSVLDQGGMPTLRRVVKTPEKWDRIVELAKSHNYSLPADPNAKALNGFLESRKEADPGRHEELCSKVVRLVGRGEYVVAKPGEPIEGHFALAAPEYGHTTAPNRRAPDLVNQRIEKAYAQGEECPYTVEELEELAMHFSQQERTINNVERQVHRSASAKLMKDKIGQTFPGRVHKELHTGTLVRLKEPYVTGLVQRKLQNETGDEVRVRVDGVNVEKGHIDFSLAPEQMVDGFVLKS